MILMHYNIQFWVIDSNTEAVTVLQENLKVGGAMTCYIICRNDFVTDTVFTVYNKFVIKGSFLQAKKKAR